jgi:UDPglucose 6-dehydrogenase
VLTEWDEFRNIDWQRLAGSVERPLVLDGRNVLCGTTVAAHGFQYLGIGGVSEKPATAISSASDKSNNFAQV